MRLATLQKHMTKLGRAGLTGVVLVVALILSEAFTVGFMTISCLGNPRLGAVITVLTCLTVGAPLAWIVVGLMFDLDRARQEVNALKRLLPICTQCKRIRDEEGGWNQLESYLHDQGAAKFTHSLCPTCTTALYPELFPAQDAAVVHVAKRDGDN